MQINKESEMSKLLKNDYLIFLSIETTHDQDSFKFNYRKLVTDPQLDSVLQRL